MFTSITRGRQSTKNAYYPLWRRRKLTGVGQVHLRVLSGGKHCLPIVVAKRVQLTRNLQRRYWVFF